MFQLEKIFHFEAGHQLVHHDGKCSHPHGHSYTLRVRIKSSTLQESGPKKNMVIDFSDISKIVKKMIIDYFDHKWVNDTLCTDSPTTEFIAKWIYDHLKEKLPNLDSISISETHSSSVTYRPTVTD